MKARPDSSTTSHDLCLAFSTQQMIFKPGFPTRLHQDAAELVRDYFLTLPNFDTVLVVNSCARGQAIPESDLDFAILVKPETTANVIKNVKPDWLTYSAAQAGFLKYKESTHFAHLHLDIFGGNYIYN